MEKGLSEALGTLTVWGSNVWTELVHVGDLALDTFLFPIYFILALFS